MWIKPKEEKFDFGYSYFDRKRIRKIYIHRSESGIYCVNVKWLDKKTLKTGKVIQFFTEETLRIITTTFLSHYCK